MKRNSFKKIVSALSLTLALTLMSVFSAPSVVSAADPYGRFEGSGTVDDPFLISTADDLMKLKDFSATVTSVTAEYKTYQTAFFKLTNEIDMAGYDWDRPMFWSSNVGFQGDFDGSGFAIRNLSNKNCTPHTGNLGLFGDIKGGKVHDLILTDVDFYGRPVTYGMGGITGALDAGGAIENCIVTGTLTVTGMFGSNIGGIAGLVCGTQATISHCTFDGDIVVDGGITEDICSNLGGIVGGIANFSSVTLSDCYSAGTISRLGRGPATAGKIVGGASNDNWVGQKFFNCTTSMVIYGETSLGVWTGYHGIELSDINVYNIALSSVSDNKVAVFDIFADFKANNVNLVEIVLSYDAAKYDVTAVNSVEGATVQSVKVENGTVKLLIGVSNELALGHDAEQLLAVVTVTPKAGQQPATAELDIVSFKGYEAGVEVDLTAGVTTLSSPFNYRVPSDANGDGVVSAEDLSLVLFYFGCSANELPTGIFADVNGDGVVDMADVTLIVNAIF